MDCCHNVDSNKYVKGAFQLQEHISESIIPSIYQALCCSSTSGSSVLKATREIILDLWAFMVLLSVCQEYLFSNFTRIDLLLWSKARGLLIS